VLRPQTPVCVAVYSVDCKRCQFGDVGGSNQRINRKRCRAFVFSTICNELCLLVMILVPWEIDQIQRQYALSLRIAVPIFDSTSKEAYVYIYICIRICTCMLVDMYARSHLHPLPKRPLCSPIDSSWYRKCLSRHRSNLLDPQCGLMASCSK
jgi:hypothetical protein